MAGRTDSTVAYAAAVDLLDVHPHATLAVVDDAGHALPHERPAVLRALLAEWPARVRRRDASPAGVGRALAPAAPAAATTGQRGKR
ncbi:alpha/beta fold hydrolase [Geodermatophilus sp. SYSU D00867]